MSEDRKDGAYEAPEAEEIETGGDPAETAAAAGSQ
jgi:hypothetical protein